MKLLTEKYISEQRVAGTPRLSKTQMNIKFIHITKTAGTSLENIGEEHGYLWGRFDVEYLEQFNRQKFKYCNVWHCPLQYFDTNPYKNQLLFTIVRNPYTRCISEYYCPWTGNPKEFATVAEFNEWLIEKLEQKDIVSFLPYSDYLYYDNEIVVDYVLYFENLKNGVASLFDTIILDKHVNKAYREKKYGVDDLTNETIELITKKYEKDFSLFGYTKRQSSF